MTFARDPNKTTNSVSVAYGTNHSTRGSWRVETEVVDLKGKPSVFVTTLRVTDRPLLNRTYKTLELHRAQAAFVRFVKIGVVN